MPSRPSVHSQLLDEQRSPDGVLLVSEPGREEPDELAVGREPLECRAGEPHLPETNAVVATPEGAGLIERCQGRRQPAFRLTERSAQMDRALAMAGDDAETPGRCWPRCWTRTLPEPARYLPLFLASLNLLAVATTVEGSVLMQMA